MAGMSLLFKAFDELKALRAETSNNIVNFASLLASLLFTGKTEAGQVANGSR